MAFFLGEKCMGRILAIDYGEKRIGLALSDISQFLASPYKTIENRSKKIVINEIKEIIQLKEVEEIVVGLPKTMKGTFSKKTKEVEAWVNYLKKHISIPVHLFDERLSTIQAHQVVHAKGKKVGQEKNKIDQYSASIVLQAYLDRKRFLLQ